jgi:3-isopropylmalate dehydratase small subunit
VLPGAQELRLRLVARARAVGNPAIRLSGAHRPSYADIFFNNCFKNGLLPIVLPEHEVAKLFDEVAAFVGYELTVDLERQVVVKPDGTSLSFDVQPFRKYCLLNGYDDIASRCGMPTRSRPSRRNAC